MTIPVKLKMTDAQALKVAALLSSVTPKRADDEAEFIGVVEALDEDVE